MHASEAPSVPRQSPSASRWRLKLLVLVISLVGALLVVEVVLRTRGYGADRTPWFQMYKGKGLFLMCFDRNPKGYFDIDLTDPAVRRRFYDRHGVIDMEEDYRYTPFGVVMSHDDGQQTRTGQIRPAMPDRIRLVAIGDSFTYGHGLKDEDTWPSQLESLLNADVAPGGKRFEMLNLGREGRDLPEISQHMVERVIPLQPQGVIYGWFLDDPVRVPQFMKRYPAEDHVKETVRSRPGYHSQGSVAVDGMRRCCAIYDFYVENLRDLLRYGNLAGSFLNGLYGPENGEGWAESQRLLGEMAKACRSKGAFLDVAIWPVLGDLSDDGYSFMQAHQAVREACRKLNIPVVDLRDRLKGHPESDLIIHPQDSHPNKFAARLAAEAIRDQLRQQNPAWFRP